MQNEQTPAAGRLTAESVALLKKGDWLRHKPTGWALRFLRDAGLGVVCERDNGREHTCLPGNLTFLGRPDQSGWIAHDGEVKGPVDGSGILCDFIMSDGREYIAQKHPRFWHLVAKWRPHVPSPASSSSVVQGDAGGERDAVARVDDYLRRLAKSRQHDQEFIHSFDVGEPSEACLLVSDLRAILAALSAPQAAPGEGEQS